MNHFNSTLAQISRWTQRSLLLATVTQYVLHGWLSKPNDDNQRPYFNRRQELSVDDNCLLWGIRIVIPPIYACECKNMQLLHVCMQDCNLHVHACMQVCILRGGLFQVDISTG